MRKPVILLLDGICKETYVEKDFLASSLYHDIHSHYSAIKRIPTNEILDWGLVGGDFILKYSDVIKFLVNPIRRTKITALIESTVKHYNNRNIPVVIYAHSLGTIKALDSEIKIDKLILCGCPIEFISRTASALVRTMIHPFFWSKPKVECKELYYIWSNKDLVSCRYPNDLNKFIKADKISIYETGKTHDNINYLNFIEKLKIL